MEVSVVRRGSAPDLGAGGEQLLELVEQFADERVGVGDDGAARRRSRPSARPSGSCSSRRARRARAARGRRRPRPRPRRRRAPVSGVPRPVSVASTVAVSSTSLNRVSPDRVSPEPGVAEPGVAVRPVAIPVSRTRWRPRRPLRRRCWHPGGGVSVRSRSDRLGGDPVSRLVTRPVLTVRVDPPGVVVVVATAGGPVRLGARRVHVCGVLGRVVVAGSAPVRGSST